MRRLLLLVLFLVAIPVFAQLNPNSARGFDPEKVYQLGDIDHVNLFNGNLIVTLPIGQKYPLSSALSYGLGLIYNGNPWNYRGDGGPGTEAIPGRFANAGLGWQLTFGELIAPNDMLAVQIGEGGNWLYAAPDGAERVFYRVLHHEETGTSYEAARAPDIGKVAGYTRDGSYLRLVRVGPVFIRRERDAPGEPFYDIYTFDYRVEFPDGTMHVFTSEEYETTAGAAPPVPDERSLFYRLSRIEDRFGNRVQFKYDIPENNTDDATWTITDQFGRTHQVVLSPQTFFQYQNGAQSRRLVKEVRLDAFDGQEAVYTFQYGNFEMISLPCGDSTDGYDPETGTPVERSTFVRFLQSVTLPDGSKFEMFNYMMKVNMGFPDHPTLVNCSNWAGHLKKITLPTGGAIQYEPGLRKYPGVRDDAAGDGTFGDGPRGTIGPVRQFSAAVASRKLLDSNGSTVGTWTYRSYLRNLSNDGAGGQAIPREMVVVVTDPLNNSELHYFNVFKGGADNTQGQPVCFPGGTVHDYGRQFTRSLGTSSDIYYLARESYSGPCTTLQYEAVGGCLYAKSRCVGPDSVVKSPLRRSYSHYENDTLTTLMNGRDSDQNFRLRGSRAAFYDDPGCYGCVIDELSSDFDGLGHYRTVTRSSLFPNTPVRTVTTRYNGDSNPNFDGSYSGYANSDPDHYMVAPSAPWLLNLHDRVTTSQSATATAEAGTAVEDRCFDRNTGFLQRRRTLVGTNPGTKDLLVTLDQVAGNVTAENYYGGDVQALPENFDTCNQALSAGRQYRMNHGYFAGARQWSQYDGVGFKSLDLDIDVWTGLVKTSRDTAGVATTFHYDAMGRVLEERPYDDAWTEIVYDSISRPARVVFKRNDLSNETLTESWTYYDGFGRQIMSKNRMPDSSGRAQQWSTQRTEYDALGRRSAATVPFYRSTGTWEDISWPHKTSFTYDAFGRPRVVTAPDGKSSELTYAGIRQVTSTQSVATGLSDPAETPVSAVQTYDGLGRLIAVEEGSGVNGAMVTTSYAYDLADRLVKVSTVAPSTQLRSFTYDNRGFLLRERHPEKGVAGNGEVVYRDHDARGHATRKYEGTEGGPFDLTFEFDIAERLRFVRGLGPNGRRVLKELTYATDSSPVGATTTGNDLRKGKLHTTTRFHHDPVLRSIAVTETYVYNGRAGRIGGRNLSVNSTSAFDGASFAFAQSYDELGNVLDLSYPTTVPLATPRSISFTHTNGLLTAVDNYATITYQANGLVADVTHSGGLTETWDPDLHGMARPHRIRATAPDGTSWMYGDFAYDGAGNPMQIGSRAYRYDKVGRLVREQHVAEFQPIGSTQTVSYTYDAFGNRTKRAWGSIAGDALARGVEDIAVNSATNRLVGVVYDDAGNVTQRAGIDYIYDAGGAMMAQTVAGTPGDIRYLYTADDERVAIVERIAGSDLALRNRTTWTLRGMDNQLLRSYVDDSTSGTRTWTLKEDQIWRGKSLLAAIDSAAAKHYAVDHLGSPRMVVNSLGQRLGEQHFDAFGKGGALGAGSLQFTGHERDRAFTLPGSEALDYMHARYARTGDGRFLAVDPEFGNLLRPQSWNRYTYVLNNPARFVDPDGRRFQPFAAIVVTADFPWNKFWGNFFWFSSGVANGFGSDLILGVGRRDVDNDAYRFGQLVGDAGAMVFGFYEMQFGIAGNIAALPFDATGVGALVGVPVHVVSTGAIAHGAVTTAVGAIHFMSGVKQRKADKHGTFRGRESKRANDEAVDRVAKELGLNRKQRRRLHDEIGREGIHDYEEIRRTALAMFR